MDLSGRAILEALCAGESAPMRLAKLVRSNVHAKEEQLVAALTAEVREHHRFLLGELLCLIEAQDRSIKPLEAETLRQLRPFEEKIARGGKITGGEPTRLDCFYRYFQKILP